MTRARNTRLARLAARRSSAITEAASHRAALEARVAIGAVLRETLPQLGVDPARVTMLRVCDEAAAELAAAATPASDLRGSADEGRAISKAEAVIERLAQRYRDDPRIDFGSASLMQVLAWCVARYGVADEHGSFETAARQPPQDENFT